MSSNRKPRRPRTNFSFSTIKKVEEKKHFGILTFLVVFFTFPIGLIVVCLYGPCDRKVKIILEDSPSDEESQSDIVDNNRETEILL